MDKLARQLKEDARQIDAPISDEFDRRLRASLEGIRPEADNRSRADQRSPLFWWASSLTGAAAAILLIVMINAPPDRPSVTSPGITEPPPRPLTIPTIRWQAETAVLTSPLEQEMEDLQSDLKKAEEVVRQDIERLF
jgi:hypothetical protein